MGKLRYDVLGQRFERLVAVDYVGNVRHKDGRKGQRLVLCRCDCGREVTSPASQLRYGERTSCGCANTRPLAERFWEKVEKRSEGCWTWIGARNSCGYGKIVVDESEVDAHRVAFFIEHGRWPEPCCLHRCDNPSCVNPSHLFEGTHQDNRDDCAAKDRHNRGERHGHAKLTRALVREIRTAEGSQRSIAARFGITQTHVSAIRRCVAWSHLSD